MTDAAAAGRPSIVDIPASASERRIALIVALLSVLVLVLVAPIAREPWAAVPAFIPAYQSAVVVNDLVTAALLFALHRELRRASILLLAGGYLCTAPLVVAHALSFPDLFGPGSLVGGAQTTVWLWLAWHVALPLAAIGYALLAGRPRDAPVARGATALAVALPLGVASLAVTFAVAAHERLPVLLDGNRYIAGMTRPVLALPLVLSLLALAALVLRRRLRSTLDLWLAVAMGAWTVEVLLSAVLNSGRFEAGFYVGRLYGLLASCTVLFALLATAARVHGRLARALAADRDATRAVLRESEERLRLAGEAGGVGAWELDLRTGARRWSDTTYRLFGVPPGTELTRDFVFGLIHPDDRARVAAAVAREFTEAGPLPEEEYRIRRLADGAERTILSRFKVLADAATGRPARQVGVLLDVTEERATRAALRASEERYRLAVESARDHAIVTLDGEGRITGWNAGAERMMGYSEAEALGQPTTILFIQEDRAAGAPEAEMRKARQEGRAENERWHLRRDGSRFWGSGIVTPLADGSGYVKVFQDRTREHEAREELRRNEVRLRVLGGLDEALRLSPDAPAAMAEAAGHLLRHLGASRCAYADVEADGDRFTIRNDATAPGMASSAGTYSLDLFGPRAAADMRAGRMLVLRDVAAELAPGEGRETFAAIGIAAIVCCPLVKDGRLVAMMAVHQDRPRDWQAEEIGLVEAAVERCWAHVERVAAEARRRESEARYRTLFEAIEVGFCIVELKFDAAMRPVDYRLAEINPAFERQTGLHGAAGKWASEAVPGLERHWFETYGRVALTGEAVRFENYAEPFGRWYDVYAFRTGAPEDQRVGILFNDITERRRAEAELRRLNEALELRVAEEVAAREAAQARLAHAQRMEALGQLAGGIAHDFNNVLQAVGGGARLIEGAPTDAGRVRRIAGMVREAAERGAGVTRRLLAFSRRADLRAEPLDVRDLLAATQEVLAHTLGAGIRVQVEVEAALPPVLADKGQLETVLVNLASNARDAMAGQGTITLAAEAALVGPGEADGILPGPLPPGAYVRLSVTDTGEGMSPQVLARASEPFFTTKEKGKGTGLGLAMARGFAEQSGGALRIESAPGQGTTVLLWLPVAEEDAPSPVAALPARVAKPGPDGRRSRIVLVDDEAIVREITAEGLRAAGYDVRVATGAAEALALLDRGEVADLLVSDLSMPGTDGLALIREAQRRRPGLPAILLTGFATDATELAMGGALSGAFSLLRKPLDARALADRVAVLLEAAEAVEAGRSVN